MSAKKKDERCPHCGCPEVHTFVRQSSRGVYSYTSCPGCNSFNGEPPKARPKGTLPGGQR